MSFPLVSIVIPAYKAEHFEQTLRSAIGQTYPNIEILVSDNCPTEAIREICSKFNGVIYQRSSVVRLGNVIGAFFSGKGQFIKPLFDDDLLHPFCVERMVAAILSRDDVEMVFSASSVINAVNEKIEFRRPYANTGFLSGLELQRAMAIGFRNPVGECSTILFKRTKLWELGCNKLFAYGNGDFSRGLSDVVFYWNLTRGGQAFYIDEELSYFRRDLAIASNSNPTVNPDFGYCMADWVDLLIESHGAGVISSPELLAAKPNVEVLAGKCSELFIQVRQSVARYEAYAGSLSISAEKEARQ